MIDLNVRALTELSLAFVDSLARHRGGILNVASIAAFLPGPGMAVYYASKAYVLSFSEALHRELAGRGIRVTALCPGPVADRIPGALGDAAARAPPRIFELPAERVAQIGYDAPSCAASAWSSPGSATRSRCSLMRLMPHALLLRPSISAAIAYGRRIVARALNSPARRDRNLQKPFESPASCNSRS